MKLVFALGNPEKKYDNTRHNTGFFMADTLAAHYGASFAHKSKHKADIAECIIGGEKVITAKPTTYYNLVGESARSLIDFYKIPPHDVLIIHDELSLPFGTLRIRQGGRDAGNNGIKSLHTHLSEVTWRLRIGIANETLSVIGSHGFVLGHFSKNEATQLPVIADRVRHVVEDFAHRSIAPHTVQPITPEET